MRDWIPPTDDVPHAPPPPAAPARVIHDRPGVFAALMDVARTAQDCRTPPADTPEPAGGELTATDRQRLADCPRRWGDWDDLPATAACPDCGWGRPAHPTTAEVERRCGTPEPATAPAEPAQDSPAGDHPATDTPEGSAVLGRGLLDRDGNAWPAKDRAWAESEHGPVREVLLVSPKAGWVLDEAVQLVRRLGGANAIQALAAAVGAEPVGDRPAEPAPEPDPQRELAPQVAPPTEGPVSLGVAPEPDGGTGWDRDAIDRIIADARKGHVPPEHILCPEDADEVEALLANRDRLAEQLPREAADRDRLSSELETERARWGHYKRQYLGALDEEHRLRAELATARRDAAALDSIRETVGDLGQEGNG